MIRARRLVTWDLRQGDGPVMYRGQAAAQVQREPGPVGGLPEPQVADDGHEAAEHLDAALENARYYYPPERAPATKVTLRNLLTKPGWTKEVIQTFRGVISALEKPIKDS